MLIRDPYAVYAKKVLDLRPLERIDADAGLPERGQIIHAVLEQFVNLPAQRPRPGRRLVRARAASTSTRVTPRRRSLALWWPRFEAVAVWFCGQQRQRQEEIARLGTELEGSLSVDAGSGSYRIRARADRIEVRRDGGLAILDYKTGALPGCGGPRRPVARSSSIEAADRCRRRLPGIPAIVPGRAALLEPQGQRGAPARSATRSARPRSAS